MHLPHNTFRRVLRNGMAQFGRWVGLADHYAAEAVAGTGFDQRLAAPSKNLDAVDSEEPCP